jgi:hypothetical protein
MSTQKRGRAKAGRRERSRTPAKAARILARRKTRNETPTFDLLLYVATFVFLFTQLAHGGGPKYVAGVSYFDSSVKGNPVLWTQSPIQYFTDLGSLNSFIPQVDANAFVSEAFTQWTDVDMAAIAVSRAGALDEDVSGTNVYANPDGTITMPADIQPTATDKPLAFVYDFDGEVVDAFLGQGAGDPSLCFNNAVLGGPDNFASDGSIVHALVVINGNCMQSSDDPDVKYHLVRLLGQVLGLDWSQLNINVDTQNPPPTADDIAGFPVMHNYDLTGCVPIAICFPGTDPTVPKMDDRAAVGRLYPVTADNIERFPFKQLFHENTGRIYGSVWFVDGAGNRTQPMQGVNVVARWVDPSTGQVSRVYAAAAVSGFRYHGDAGNPVNGPYNTLGQRFDEFGSDDSTLEGFFDIGGLEFPLAGNTTQYQLSIEGLDPAWSREVGPYDPSQVQPSGTGTPIVVTVTKGQDTPQDMLMIGSALALTEWGAPSNYEAPATLPGSGDWFGSLASYGRADYFQLDGHAGRTLSVSVTALDETGTVADTKMRPVIGMWALADPPGTLAAASTPSPFNVSISGESRLDAALMLDGSFRIGITDERGDGRPDYRYRAQVLYVDSVAPDHVSAQSGSAIVVRGVGFHPGITTGAGAANLSLFAMSAAQMVVNIPSGMLDGTQTLTVSDPANGGTSSVIDGLTVGGSASDSFSLIEGWNPATPVGAVTTNPIRVRDLTSAGVPVNGATVVWAAGGGATLTACGGASTCTVYTDESGEASTNATVTAPGGISITATLAPASLGTAKQVTATVVGTESALDLALVSQYRYLATGTNSPIGLTARLLSNGIGKSGSTINFQVLKGSGSLNPAAATTDANGYASSTLTVSGLTTDVWVSACVAPNNVPCQTFYLTAVPQSSLRLEAVSGGGQLLRVGQAFQPIVVRVTDSASPPNLVEGVSVAFQMTTFEPDNDAPFEVPGESGGGDYPQRVILAQSSAAGVSGADGIVSVQPSAGSISGPVEIEITATGGNSTLEFEVESMWPGGFE